MRHDSNRRLVILSGPSCAGKTPLFRALGKFHPELYANLHKLVLYNSRAPRPGERDGIDYYYRTRAQIEALRTDNRYVVLEARRDLQAMDILKLEELLERTGVFFEGNPIIARALQTHPSLEKINRLSIFVSPLSKEEIIYLQAPERNVSLQDCLTEVMRRKLLRRTRRHNGDLSSADLENIETRASGAYRDLQEAWHFQYVIPNHDGEDSDNWEAFYYPIGDARKTLEAFVALLQGATPPGAEKWEQNLLAAQL